MAQDLYLVDKQYFGVDFWFEFKDAERQKVPWAECFQTGV